MGHGPRLDTADTNADETNERIWELFFTKPQLAKYYKNQPCSSCNQRPLDNICDTCPSRAVPHVRHDSKWPCLTCQKSYCLPKGDPDHASIGLCACVDWIEWKLSAPGRQQISAAIAIGNFEGIEGEHDQNLAVKLQSEEESRRSVKASQNECQV